MILVIGASSFIGVYTIEALQKAGYTVLGTGRNRTFQKYYADRGVGYLPLNLRDPTDFSTLPPKGVDAVILLAALLPANSPVNLEQSENAEDYFTVNTIGTIRVLEYCRRHGINRVISTTSYAEVFRSWGKNKPLSEKEPIGFPPTGDHAAYAISKRAATEMLDYYNHQHGMHNVVFRLPPVYGAGPHGSLFMNGARVKSGLQVFIEHARHGEDIEVFGNGNVRRDVVYVKDVAKAFINVLQSKSACGVYNIASGKGVTLRQQAEIVARVFAGEKGLSHIIKRPELPNHSISCVLDIAKAREAFGYCPEYTDFSTMMEDYKMEEERGTYSGLFR